jgi:hypothetical protein
MHARPLNLTRLEHAILRPWTLSTFTATLPSITRANSTSAIYPMSSANTSRPSGVAVYCGSSLGNQEEYRKAAVCKCIPSVPFAGFDAYSDSRGWYLAVGASLARAKRLLVYGGGAKGIMGIVSGESKLHLSTYHRAS